MFGPLKEFIIQHSADTDIFCFQEVFKNTSQIREKDGVRMNLLQDLQEILPNHRPHFATQSSGYDYTGYVDFPLEYGVVTFVKDVIDATSSGHFFEPNSTHFLTGRVAEGKAQHVSFVLQGKRITVCNLRGLWDGGGKADSLERMEQSKKIKAFFDGLEGEKILAGDFNLLPDTVSMQLLEVGMKNLIKEYGVASTRSHYYVKESKFADYILVSPGIVVHRFGVLQDVVSDHLPLLLEFE